MEEKKKLLQTDAIAVLKQFSSIHLIF